MLLSIEEILNAIEGKIYTKGKYHNYSSITTDTRKLETNSIFIALKGDNFNGNDYVTEGVNKGAIICIVDEIKFDASDIGDRATVIVVSDTRKALKDLAKYYRSKLDIKIIGVTGSTGKTSTKDIIAAVLGKSFKVFKTKGNFNNEIGLPLMILSIDESYEVAVLEMGMNNLEEIHRLAQIARPDIAVITNIGVSHIENLKSRENILRAKLEITDFFEKQNTLIVNGDNDLLSGINSENFKIIKVGTNEDHEYHAENILLREDSIDFEVIDNIASSKYKIHVPAVGRHNVLNSLLAVACGRLMGMDCNEIAEGILAIEATSRRLDIFRTDKYTIIDDSYNASPDSVKAAIEVLSQMVGERKIAVLGTMKELGDIASQAHKEVAIYAKDKSIDLLLTCGEYNDEYKEGFGKTENHIGFTKNEDIVEYLKGELCSDDVLLIKASRSMRFETIVEELKNYANEGGEILH
jgi:UDP-N-acetylmuramoyl-tripeptide--D-alanyl-D-alanine ligase